MSYHDINLDAGKSSKRDMNFALQVGPVVLHVAQILHKIAISLCFDYDHGFSLTEDFLLM